MVATWQHRFSEEVKQNSCPYRSDLLDWRVLRALHRLTNGPYWREWNLRAFALNSHRFVVCQVRADVTSSGPDWSADISRRVRLPRTSYRMRNPPIRLFSQMATNACEVVKYAPKSRFRSRSGANRDGKPGGPGTETPKRPGSSTAGFSDRSSAAVPRATRPSSLPGSG